MGAVPAAWLGWRMQLVHSSLPFHPLDNPIYIPFSSSGSCCYHGNYVHSCISLASGKTPLSLSPSLSPFPAWTQLWLSEDGEAHEVSDNQDEGSS